LYRFLLEENYKLNGLVLSCSGQNIVLSCILYDLDLTIENGKEQFEKLFKKADEYDDMLKKDFGCLDRLIEK
jgi:serine protease Do